MGCLDDERLFSTYALWWQTEVPGADQGLVACHVDPLGGVPGGLPFPCRFWSLLWTTVESPI